MLIWEIRMDKNDACKDYFLNPELARHSHYEILRARFVDKKMHGEIAKQFGKSIFTIQSYCRDFKKDLDDGTVKPFFAPLSTGPKSAPKKSKITEWVIFLRKRAYANTDIQKALCSLGDSVSVSLIDQILKENNLLGMGKRSRELREKITQEIESVKVREFFSSSQGEPEKPAVADVAQLDFEANPILTLDVEVRDLGGLIDTAMTTPLIAMK